MLRRYTETPAFRVPARHTTRSIPKSRVFSVKQIVREHVVVSDLRETECNWKKEELPMVDQIFRFIFISTRSTPRPAVLMAR